MEDLSYKLKSALPNKMVDEDGNVTDLFGNPVLVAEDVYDNKPALPNKWINPDGSYSTLQELLAGGIDTDIFVPVEELPETGNPKKIYLVPDDDGGFLEYHYKNGKWDIIGAVKIDISKYSTTEEMMNAINAACLATLNSAKEYIDEQIKQIPIIDPTNFLDKTNSEKNVLAGPLQIGDNTKNISNAYLHIRKVTTPITGKNVNGASFGVNSDGTAAFFQKTYNDDGTGAKNAAVLRFSKNGLQFAMNTGSAASPTEEMYKEIATQEYVDDALENIKIEPQFIYWDGNKTNLTPWNELVKCTGPVIMSFANTYLCIVNNPQSLKLNSKLRFSKPISSISDGSYVDRSYVLVEYWDVNITGMDADRNITSLYTSYSQEKANYLDTDRRYVNVFMPTQDYQPTTKKYVDDAVKTVKEYVDEIIQEKITDALNNLY